MFPAIVVFSWKMSKSAYNALIVRQNLRLYPDVMQNQIELTVQHQRGQSLLRMPATPESMLELYRIFRADSLEDLHGQFCRIVVDDGTGRIDSMKNIIYDDYGELSDDPVVSPS